jgi:hypothetical protein
LQEIDVVARLKSLGLVKEESDQLVAQPIILKEALMAQAQQANMKMKGADKLTFKGVLNWALNMVQSKNSALLVPAHCVAEEVAVPEPKKEEQKPQLSVVVNVASPEKEKTLAEAPAAASAPELVPAPKKTESYNWQEFRNWWLPKVVAVLVLLFLLMIGSLCFSIVSNWWYKPVAAQQQMSSGENPVTSMPEIMVTNNSTAPLPVWIDNDTKPRMTLNPGDSLHVKHRNGERTRVKVGETEQIFTFEGMPLVQHMVVDK